jgi:CHAT domain
VTGSIRVQVTAAATDTGWRFTLDCPEGGWRADREVKAFSDPEWPRYPVPRQLCGPGCDHLLCAEVTPAHVVDMLDWLDSRVDGAHVVGDAIGRYLFDTLLSADWPTIVAMGTRLNREVIEVALTWSYQDSSGRPDPLTGLPLSQLPWELIRNGTNRCLCASEQRLGVAVTRVVKGTTAQVSPMLSVPPRVLFVVGTPVADPDVRAGAEMLALLREFRKAGCRIQHRILEEAKPRTLREAMRTFKPEIVHFISHGDVDRDGRGRIMLPTDDGIREMWRAEQLLENLAVVSLPPVVVLSACDSGGEVVLGPHRSAPLAAELVHGGIQVVVAMAGKVSDRASRVFTRYFGRALAEGESLVVATAQARKIAFAEASPDGVDWAVPSIFFSAGVDPDKVRRSPDPSARHVDHLVTMAGLNKDPVFCAREEFLRTFWAMLGDQVGQTGWESEPGSRPSVLAACSANGQSGVGKTRLLEQLAREALQNGHLPLMVGMDTDPPKDVGELAHALAEAMRYLGHRVLRVGDDFGGELRALYPDDRTERRSLPGQEVADLADALERDSDYLRAEAMRKYDSLFTDASRVVVLIDNLGRECEMLLGALFADRNGLNDYGLGVSPDNPVPVVLVVLTDEEPGIRRKLDRGGIRTGWLVSRKLQPFDERGEDMLAYERILLNPSPSGASDLMRTPWVFNRDLRPEEWSRNVQYTQVTLKGLPRYLVDEIVFEGYLQAAKAFAVLKNADDDIAAELAK